MGTDLDYDTHRLYKELTQTDLDRARVISHGLAIKDDYRGGERLD